MSTRSKRVLLISSCPVILVGELCAGFLSDVLFVIPQSRESADMLYGKTSLICLSLMCSGVRTILQNVNECRGWFSTGKAAGVVKGDTWLSTDRLGAGMNMSCQS